MIPLRDLPSGIADFHIQEMVRLLEYRRAHFPQSGIGVSLRWVYCPLCGNARFSCYPIMYRTRLCDDCHMELYRVFVRRYNHLVHRAVQRSLLPMIHDELLEVCYHPDRVAQTGAIESRGWFETAM
jgi:hypothetical protein